MILPITAYGDPVLKRVGKEIDKDYPKLEELIADMYETMYNAQGVGLAAPQVGRSIRLFIVDASPFAEDDETVKDFKKTFINPQVIELTGDEWAFNEGCLSIPDIHEDIFREETVKLRYQDENFEEHEEVYTGMAARVILHEYDHIEGILFTDKITPLRRRLLKGKLTNISKGKINANYKMRFPLKKGR